MRGVLDGDLVKYPLRRIGKIESTVANAILAAWATFQTRAALDYDFAKSSEAEASAASAGDQPQTEPAEVSAGEVPAEVKPESIVGRLWRKIFG